MKLFLCSIVGSCISALSSIQAAESRDDGQPLIEAAFRIVELSASDVQQLFGKKGATPGCDVAEAVEQRLATLKSADVLSAPRVVTRPGQSAQIKVGQEMQFATSFRVVETNGAWEPVMKTVESGISIIVVASPYPHDPERMRGCAEVTLSQLDSVSEKTVTPPGSQGPLRLQAPVVSTRSLTASFDMASGKTIVLGGLQHTEGGVAKSIVVLMRADVLDGNAELVAKLKGRIIREMDFRQAPLGDVIAWLSAETKNTGINFTVISSRLTIDKAGDNMSFQNSEGKEPVITFVARDMPLYDFLRHVAKLAGATVTFDSSAIAFKLP